MNYFKVLCAVMIVVIVGWSVKASAGIAGSGHDFSSASWNTGGQICQPCHTPHNALATYKPLWNHASTSTNFTLYSNTNGTFNATANQPSGDSKLCLSCHDGTIALDQFGAKIGTNTGDKLTGSANFGSDLSNDHPVSIVYNTALATADGGLKDPSAVTAVANLLRGTGATATLECSSCHDVHNSVTAAGASPMLVATNNGSALCLTCHTK